MKPLTLGPLSLDIRDVASQGNAILGIRDSGKSYTATWLAERLLDAGIPFVAFDPIGIWRNLRVGDGGAGYPVIVAGGLAGDLPLTPEAAPEIVRAALDRGASLVIDLFDMKLSKADWRRIVESCIRLLLYQNQPHGLRHIFLEEASEFVPQRVGPDQGRVYAEIEKLARMGGNALLGYTLINQRAEEVNKAVLELCDNLFLHRQKGRNSLTALSKWLDIADAKGAGGIIKSLPTLPQGECWAWAAGTDKPVHVKIPKKRTFHPNRREMRGDAAAPGVRAAVDVAAFVDDMKGSLAKILAEAAANDPAALKKRIAELQREIAAKPAAAADPAAIEAARAAAYDEGYSRGVGYGLNRGVALGRGEAADELARALKPVMERATALAEVAPAAEPPARPDPARTAGAARPVVRDAPTPSRARSFSAAGTYGDGPGEKMPRAERRILTALAQYPDGRTKTQVAVLTGYAVTGGGFLNALGALRTRGWIEGRDTLQATAAGVAALGAFEPLPQGDALLQHWRGQLGKAERSILDVLAARHPGTMTRDELAERAGYAPDGGGFNNAIGRLRTLELIGGDRSALCASDDLFG